MSDHVYRVIEVVGSSTEGSDGAIANAVARAAETVRNLEWFEVIETRGHIVDGAVAHTQVTVKIGFRIEPGESAAG
ncbi:dodecin [Antrihabitans sp. YC2-6]|uniref:dodecin n=1 Tax=Antrihabitans sp. YC2-6 TaxID=2799498 RepID=UPI0018F5B696|nr:dodecin [Antrihabitans sp. YC2-6]MBJ8343117.1 dodecin family protein [Antrihabitans sp. YC2-6]